MVGQGCAEGWTSLRGSVLRNIGVEVHKESGVGSEVVPSAGRVS